MTIKNGDLPAMPVSTNESICQMTGTLKQEFAGLTKRERFAMAMAQGLLSSGATYKGSTANRHLLAADAVAHADAILAELEATK